MRSRTCVIINLPIGQFVRTWFTPFAYLNQFVLEMSPVNDYKVLFLISVTPNKLCSVLSVPCCVYNALFKTEKVTINPSNRSREAFLTGPF